MLRQAWRVGFLLAMLSGCQKAATVPEPPAVVQTADPFAGVQFDTPHPAGGSRDRRAVPDDAAMATVKLGAVAPDFVLPGVDGPTHRLSDWRGKPTIVAFWAFWCTTWKEVNAGFNRLAPEVTGRGHLVTVDVDCQWKDEFTTAGKVPYLALMDPGSAVSHQWNVQAVPTIVLVDAHGVLRHRVQGYPGDATLRAWLRER
ncbi:MAG TPA: TlpA disulfide reductase family protein [Candidatus Xenobia bacterium]